MKKEKTTIQQAAIDGAAPTQLLILGLIADKLIGIPLNQYSNCEFGMPFELCDLDMKTKILEKMKNDLGIK